MSQQTAAAIDEGWACYCCRSRRWDAISMRVSPRVLPPLFAIVPSVDISSHHRRLPPTLSIPYESTHTTEVLGSSEPGPIHSSHFPLPSYHCSCAATIPFDGDRA